ncbi:GNAT family N-acetyltransferase [Rathayibacter sp. VKM Ac-2759]|uniref:GNAT family N-acetyltransferase n=1 Tax=Rathayibacter sp. VKM Ac-2759 TaxID=2609252 RepID=UPI001318F57E|nr:GNAT family N-acetyltransferase [Rathayibacter sp. VKM Ac-2759]QHC65495.1 GNAT family N-acetyltransferase [Rathayibacter sp. VKM Ac-2759]
MLRIAPYSPDDRDDLLALALRAWEPVFPLTEDAVPPFVYRAFYPDGWRARQYADLAAVLDGEPGNVDVARLDSRAAGWVCTRTHPEDSMGEVYVLAVEPALQRQGVGRALLAHALERSRAAGMSMVMVETGDDPGHEPARRAYEAEGFERWPVARYFKDLSDE